MLAIPRAVDFPIRDLRVSSYCIPTDSPEADGTLSWKKTTLVLVEIEAGKQTGIGYTYAGEAAGRLIEELLRDQVIDRDALDIPGTWNTMVRSVRNIGRPGAASEAISAIDNALWDLKAKLLGLPLVRLLGQARESIPVYGSGGFTSYDRSQLERQLSGWVSQGISRVKIKVGQHPEQDVERVRAARVAIGAWAELFVDANGAYSRKQALAMAQAFGPYDVRWFEEPVSSDDLEGLRLLRDRAPIQMEIAAGEYGYDSVYFRRMLEAGAVDVLQADATRCLGITGFLRASALCDAWMVPLSAHTAPSIHAHACCAVEHARHLEYFHDHVRIERMLFDGALVPKGGALHPDLSRPGLGIELKKKEASRYAA